MIKRLNNLQKAVIGHPLLKASLIYSISDAINKAIPFLLLPLLTYYLSPNDFGITTNYNIYVNIIGILVGLNLNGAISVNYYKHNKSETATYISSSIFLMVVSFSLSLFIIWLSSRYLNLFLPISQNYLLAGAVIALGQSVTAINLDLWRLQQQPLKFGLYEIAQGLFAIILSFILIICFNLKWKARVDASIITASFFGICSLIFILNKGFLNFEVRKSAIKAVLHYGIPLIPYTLSSWFRMGIDRVYITKFVGASETGIYATSLQFGIIISFFTLALNNAFSPYVFKALSTVDEVELESKKLKLVKFTYLYFGILVIISVAAIFLSEYVIRHFLSSKYNGAQIFVPLSILSQTLQGMCLMFGLYILYAKKTSKLAYITIFCSMVQILMSYQLIKKFGAIGAAYSTFIVNFINLLAVWWYSAKSYEMPWSLKHKKEL